jgi:hypothetical protein
MLERALEQERAVSSTLKDHGHESLLYNSLELGLLPQVVEALKPFAQICKFACMEDNMSISYILPMLNSLKNKHCAIQLTDLPSIKSMKNTIATGLVTRWEDTVHSPLMLATIMDPRFKFKIPFHFSGSRISLIFKRLRGIRPMTTLRLFLKRKP